MVVLGGDGLDHVALVLLLPPEEDFGFLTFPKKSNKLTCFGLLPLLDGLDFMAHGLVPFQDVVETR